MAASGFALAGTMAATSKDLGGVGAQTWREAVLQEFERTAIQSAWLDLQAKRTGMTSTSSDISQMHGGEVSESEFGWRAMDALRARGVDAHTQFLTLSTCFRRHCESMRQRWDEAARLWVLLQRKAHKEVMMEGDEDFLRGRPLSLSSEACRDPKHTDWASEPAVRRRFVSVFGVLHHLEALAGSKHPWRVVEVAHLPSQPTTSTASSSSSLEPKSGETLALESVSDESEAIVDAEVEGTRSISMLPPLRTVLPSDRALWLRGPHGGIWNLPDVAHACGYESWRAMAGEETHGMWLAIALLEWILPLDTTERSAFSCVPMPDWMMGVHTVVEELRKWRVEVQATLARVDGSVAWP